MEEKVMSMKKRLWKEGDDDDIGKEKQREIRACDETGK